MSTSLIEALGPLLSGGVTSQVASALGIDERKAATALDRNHDGSVLDDRDLFAKGA